MNTTKRRFLQVLSVGAASQCLPAGRAWAAGYPNRNVTIVVPYPAGGASDAITRAVSPPLSAKLGQPVVVDNVGGAGGIIGAQKVLNAPADGYMLYRGSLSELVLAPLNLPTIKFSSEDFRMVQMMTASELGFMVRKDLPANSIDEFLAYATTMAKQRKPLTYASVGPGSVYHLLGTRLSQLSGIEMTHVPYKGGGPADQALLGGEIDFYLSPFLSQHQGYGKKGMIKILALLTKTRHPQWPDYPAITEFVRVKDLAFTMWGGVFVKKDTPQPVCTILNQAIAGVLKDQNIRTVLASLNQQIPPSLNLAEADRAYREGIVQFRELARSAGLL